MLFELSLSLIFLVISVTANVVLGFMIYKSDKKNATNIIYGLLSLVLSLWLIVIYISVHPAFLNSSLVWISLSIFLATPMTMLFYLFAKTVPEDRVPFSKG